MDATLQTLNEQFAIPDQLSFVAGPGDMPMVALRSPQAVATVALQGAHVVAFQPHGQAPVLFVSAHAHYQAGVSIRGGIPVCWPWFAQHPSDPSKPMHGFARTMTWTVLGASTGQDGQVELRLGLRDDQHTRKLWPHAFDLHYIISLDARLTIELVARNTDSAPWSCTGALHSYFAVQNISTITINGLDGCVYVDKVDGGRRKLQQGPVVIESETDRVYLDTTASCRIDDPLLGRQIVIDKTGSRSTVIWNPWAEKARQINDFGAEEYASMVCVETANALDDVVTVAPGEEHRLRAIISV